jgi:hypothetical protein
MPKRCEDPTATSKPRVRDHRRKVTVTVEHVRCRELDLQPERLHPRADHGNGLRVRVGVEEHRVQLLLDRAVGERDGLRNGSGFVQQRGIRERQRRQLGDHGLEVEQRFQSSLADLRLVGRVCGVPGRVLEDVPLHHGRRDGGVVPLPDE